jgi:enoyl-CoA hydratase/carnithine racemase
MCQTKKFVGEGGKAFCSGGDIRAITEVKGGPVQQGNVEQKCSGANILQVPGTRFVIVTYRHPYSTFR